MLPFILISETLLNTTHTGVEIAEDVYKSTGTTVDDDFEESKAEVVSILPTDISSSSSSSQFQDTIPIPTSHLLHPPMNKT